MYLIEPILHYQYHTCNRQNIHYSFEHSSCEVASVDSSFNIVEGNFSSARRGGGSSSFDVIAQVSSFATVMMHSFCETVSSFDETGSSSNVAVGSFSCSCGVGSFDVAREGFSPFFETSGSGDVETMGGVDFCDFVAIGFI